MQDSEEKNSQECSQDQTPQSLLSGQYLVDPNILITGDLIIDITNSPNTTFSATAEGDLVVSGKNAAGYSISPQGDLVYTFEGNINADPTDEGECKENC